MKRYWQPKCDEITSNTTKNSLVKSSWPLSFYSSLLPLWLLQPEDGQKKRSGHPHCIPTARSDGQNRQWSVRMDDCHKQRVHWTGEKTGPTSDFTPWATVLVFCTLCLYVHTYQFSLSKSIKKVTTRGTRDEGCYLGHWLSLSQKQNIGFRLIPWSTGITDSVILYLNQKSF